MVYSTWWVFSRSGIVPIYSLCRLFALEQRLVEQWFMGGYALFTLIPRLILTRFKLYSRTGKLVAVTCQEGVVRANRRGPTESKAKM